MANGITEIGGSQGIYTHTHTHNKLVFACSFARVFALLLIWFMWFYGRNSCNFVKFDSARTGTGKCGKSEKRGLKRVKKSAPMRRSTVCAHFRTPKAIAERPFWVFAKKPTGSPIPRTAVSRALQQHGRAIANASYICFIERELGEGLNYLLLCARN